MTNNKLQITILFLVGLIFAGGLVYLLARNWEKPENTVQPAEKPKITVRLVRQDGATDIFFSPTEKDVEISAFQFNASLPAGIPGDKITITINKELEKQAWSFPIAKIDGREIKIAGFRLGNSPFVLTDNFFVGTVNSDNFEVQKDGTVFYSSDALTKLPFTVQ